MKHHWTWILLLAPLFIVACEREEPVTPMPETRNGAETTEQTQSERTGAEPAGETAQQETAQQETAQQETTQQETTQQETTQQETASQDGVDPELGKTIYQRSCASCHEQGIAGAPVTGDREAWAPRIDKGMDVLVENSIQGFQGNQGVMPPRGGNPNLTDQEVAAAVEYMVNESQ